MTSLATIYKTVTLLKEMGEVSELPQEVARSTAYQIVSHRFDFFRMCPQCQEKG
jgi:Fe2+ or Zn2+ uptake regulation protein